MELIQFHRTFTETPPVCGLHFETLGSLYVIETNGVTNEFLILPNRRHSEHEYPSGPRMPNYPRISSFHHTREHLYWEPADPAISPQFFRHNP